jgi:hypothetical protein
MIKKVSELLLGKFNLTAAALITCIFSFYYDQVLWILWISNRTELLSSLFYISAIIFTINYLFGKTENNFYLILAAISFVLSTLSKQQSIHFPVLVIFLIFVLREKISQDRFAKVFKVSLIGIIYTVVFSILNYYLFVDSLNQNLFVNIWKKPFAAIGTLNYVIFPFSAESTYGFFLQNKIFAFGVGIIILFIFVLLSKRKKINLKPLVYILIFTSIIFYPRIFLEGSERINSILNIWFLLSFFLLISKVTIKQTYKISFLSVFLIAHVSFAYYRTEDAKSYYRYLFSQYKNYSLVADNNSHIVLGRHTYLLPYYDNFLKNDNFGKSDINYLPILYGSIERYYIPKSPSINSVVRSNVVRIESNDPLIEIAILDEKFENKYLKNSRKGSSGRGFEMIEIVLPDSLAKKSLVYHNGMKWLKLRQSSIDND